jgi:hypothetical protein
MKLSEFKEAVKNVLRERSINAISKLQQKNLDDISKALEYFKKNKHTDKKEPFIKLLKKLGKVKIDLAKELDMKVSGMYKDAEYKGESVVSEDDTPCWDTHKVGNPKTKISSKTGKRVNNCVPKNESVNEGASSEEKRIAMLAVKKQAKYRNVSLSQAIQDQINALEELKRQYKGK